MRTRTRIKTSDEWLPMRRGGSVVLLGAVTVVGLAAGVLVPGGGASSKASHATSHLKATTHVTVTATDTTGSGCRSAALPRGG